jgi:predicted ATP-dependent protease
MTIMAARELAASETELPRFSFDVAERADVFDLDSHRRAREALDFGLSVSGIGFNIFVIGDDRAARMTSTLAYLDAALKSRPPRSDWIYLRNFLDPASATPVRLPLGTGRAVRDGLSQLVRHLRDGLAAAFTSDVYQARFLALREKAQGAVQAEIGRLREVAHRYGMEVAEAQDGGIRLVRPAGAAEAPPPDEAADRELSAAFTQLQRRGAEARTELGVAVETLSRSVAADVAGPMLDALEREFANVPGLAPWLAELREDVIDNPGRFRMTTAEGQAAAEGVEPPERRYAVNLLVDRADESHPSVVLESNPTYENLFGRIEYHQAQGSIETDFTLIRSGALHRANDGVLVLRAEALAANPGSWAFLKAALRDREIRIEEPQRAQMTPIAGAPKPGPIPLDVKVVIVGAPRWYSLFFGSDPDFYVYFKIKADIDSDMEATPLNLSVYAGLVRDMAKAQGLAGASEGATRRLLGTAARWSERRDRLSARVERIEDLVAEAAVRDLSAGSRELTEDAVRQTYVARRRRNSRIEDRILRSILDNEVLIATRGGAVGQINALTVYDLGDQRFGTPVRVTARASVGRAGIVNIERDVALGGPIQQKGAMVLQGFLAATFAQLRPLSFTCSITFEQTYGGVEGDSASLAELIATLSDLARLPIRQDLAITGSVNQAGNAQAIGGAYDKVEGFYHACAAQPGGLTGSQGVILPEANRAHLALRDEVAESIAAGRFHVWSVTTVQEAAELLIGRPAGAADAAGDYPPDSIFGRVARRLAEFDRLLADRELRAAD